MSIALRSAVISLALMAALPAQSAPENPGSRTASTRTITVPGLAGGNASVSALVTYPATSAAANAPLDLSACPCPVIVFGHGFSLTADLYATLYSHWASQGWVVVAPTTEQGLFAGNLPRFILDMEAALIGLRTASQASGNPLLGAVTPAVRAIAAGHSFGGAGALVAGSTRPDLFAAVVTLAATSTSPQGVDILGAAAGSSLPALHVGASTDTIVPPPQNLDPIYAATPATRILVEISGGTHSYFHEAWYLDRLTESPGAITVAQQQLLVRRYATAFMQWQARGDVRWLDALVGPAARSDARLSRHQLALGAPVLFAEAPPASGQTYVVHPQWAAGDGVVFALSFIAADVPTPFGALLVDPMTATIIDLGTTNPQGFATLSATMPGGAPYQGLTAFSQCLMLHSGTLRLSNLLTTTIP